MLAEPDQRSRGADIDVDDDVVVVSPESLPVRRANFLQIRQKDREAFVSFLSIISRFMVVIFAMHDQLLPC